MNCEGCGKPLPDRGKNGRRRFCDHTCRPWYRERARKARERELDLAIEILTKLKETL